MSETPWTVCPHCSGLLAAACEEARRVLRCSSCHVIVRWSAADWIVWAPLMQERMRHTIDSSVQAVWRSREILQRLS